MRRLLIRSLLRLHGVVSVEPAPRPMALTLPPQRVALERRLQLPDVRNDRPPFSVQIRRRPRRDPERLPAEADELVKPDRVEGERRRVGRGAMLAECLPRGRNDRIRTKSKL